MNNEPVAWMLTLPDGTHDWILDGNGCEGYIPLYTHPAKTLTDAEQDACFNRGYKEGARDILNRQAKTLTDKEILGAIARGWCSEKNSSKTMDSDLAMAIADEIKAILRKAQEK
jgi:hypothetical protein